VEAAHPWPETALGQLWGERWCRWWGHGRPPTYWRMQSWVFRPGALGQVKVPALLRFPDDDSFMFNHVNLGHNFTCWRR
jgi:hypothetical protein